MRALAATFLLPLLPLLPLSLSLSLSLSGCATDAERNEDCSGDKCDYLGQFPAINAKPKSVLFVPMSSGYLGVSEQKWQSDDVEFDRTIRELTAMYRAKGVTEIVTVPRIERWEDLDQHASDFAGTTFDRVIIVGHGALDGPLTRGDVTRTIENSRIVEQWTLQPGVVFEYSTTYSADFADFVDSNRETLLTQYDSVTDALFGQVTQQQQDDYDACAQRVWDETEFANCEQGCDVTCETFEGQERNVNCFDGCFNQCTDDYINELAGPACSPIQNEFSETVDEDAYNKFAGSLASLTADDGLIFLGFCNAATDAYDATVVNELSGLRSYTDLIASTTGRHASGPIGKTSGQDIIDRVTRMEKDRDQKYLYIAAPPKP